MTKPTQLTISLTAELEAFIEQRLASGRLATAGEVVREGLRLLEAREQQSEAVIAELRHEIEVGMKQARAGQLRDGREVFEELRRRLRPDA